MLRCSCHVLIKCKNDIFFEKLKAPRFSCAEKNQTLFHTLWCYVDHTRTVIARLLQNFVSALFRLNLPADLQFSMSYLFIHDYNVLVFIRPTAFESLTYLEWYGFSETQKGQRSDMEFDEAFHHTWSLGCRM